MKIFRLSFGFIEKFIVAEDIEDAKKQGEDPKLHPDLHFRPFEVQEVIVPGYEITVTPVKNEEETEEENTPDEPSTDETNEDDETEIPNFDAMERDELKEWLDQHGIEYDGRIGTEKLRELAKEVAAE